MARRQWRRSRRVQNVVANFLSTQWRQKIDGDSDIRLNNVSSSPPTDRTHGGEPETSADCHGQVYMYKSFTLLKANKKIILQN